MERRAKGTWLDDLSKNQIHSDFNVKSEFRLQFQSPSCTLGSGQTEGHGGGRHQDVSEDGSVSCRKRGGALLQ